MFRLFVAAIVLFYAAAAWRGWEIGSGKRGLITQEARQQPGGYRSYHYWRGGK